jgi:biopolymer transport protein ExbB
LEELPTYTLLNMFYDGGAFMYALVLCSLFALGVIIAKAYTLYTANRRSQEVLEQFEQLATEARVDEAIDLAERTPGPVAAIVHAGLKRVRERSQSSADIEQALKTTGVIELGFLERGLPVLATVSNVAPLLGFLGTVAGMISAFGSIAEAGQVEASLVAGGIKVALITTATGLLIAVPVNIAYNFFVSRVDKLIREMEEGSAAVLNLIWDLERDGRLQLAGVAAAPGAAARGAATRNVDAPVEGVGTPDTGAGADRGPES